MSTPGFTFSSSINFTVILPHSELAHVCADTTYNCNTLLPIIGRRSMWMCFDEQSRITSTFRELLYRKLRFKTQPPTISSYEGKSKVHP